MKARLWVSKSTVRLWNHGLRLGWDFSILALGLVLGERRCSARRERERERRHTYVYIYIYIYTYTYTSIYVYVCNVCMHVCMCTNIYSFAYTKWREGNAVTQHNCIYLSICIDRQINRYVETKQSNTAGLVEVYNPRLLRLLRSAEPNLQVFVGLTRCFES